MNDATLALTELAAILTPIAPVKTGRAALETTSDDLPVIALWWTADRVADDQGYGRRRQYTRAVTIELKVSATADYDVQLDNLLQAVRSVLAAQEVGALLGGYATAIRELPCTPYAPAPNGDTAVLQIPIEFDYLTRF